MEIAILILLVAWLLGWLDFTSFDRQEKRIRKRTIKKINRDIFPRNKE